MHLKNGKHKLFFLVEPGVPKLADILGVRFRISCEPFALNAYHFLDLHCFLQLLAMLPCEYNTSSDSSDTFDSTLGPIVQCHHTKIVLSYPCLWHSSDKPQCHAWPSFYTGTFERAFCKPKNRVNRHGCAVAFVSKAATRWNVTVWCNGMFPPKDQEHGPLKLIPQHKHPVGNLI